MFRSHSVISALDIGTSKITAVVGEVQEGGELKILGYGHAPCSGLKKGLVSNIERTVQSINQAVEEAERKSGQSINEVYVGLSSSHTRCLLSHGVVAVRMSQVTQDDTDRVIDAAKTISFPENEMLVHLIPQEFTIDNQSDIHDPIGMAGVRLEADVCMVLASTSVIKNIRQCINQCYLKVSDLVLTSITTVDTLLTEDEKELGVCLIDIGAGVTDITVVSKGFVRHTSSIPVAGNQVTNDIAIALRTPTQSAESIKIYHSCCLARLVDDDVMIDVPSMGDRPSRKLAKRTLVEVVEPRYEEILNLVLQRLQEKGFSLNGIASGFVLTGGASKMEGLIDLAEETFGAPVRLADLDATSYGGLDDLNAQEKMGALGVLRYFALHKTLQRQGGRERPPLYHRFFRWVKDSF